MVVIAAMQRTPREIGEECAPLQRPLCVVRSSQVKKKQHQEKNDKKAHRQRELGAATQGVLHNSRVAPSVTAKPTKHNQAPMPCMANNLTCSNETYTYTHTHTYMRTQCTQTHLRAPNRRRSRVLWETGQKNGRGFDWCNHSPRRITLQAWLGTFATRAWTPQG